MSKARETLIAAVLAVQVGVPAYVLAQPDRPAPFGWQMYAARFEIPVVTTIDRAGERRKVDDPPPLANPRPEVDMFAAYPPAVCAEHPQAVAVHLRSGAPEREQTTRC